jgi:hypothetical protein
LYDAIHELVNFFVARTAANEVLGSKHFGTWARGVFDLDEEVKKMYLELVKDLEAFYAEEAEGK